MDDLLLTLAVEVCEAHGFQLFPGRCDRCGYPLVENPSQLLPFCWFCACDKKTSMIARATLMKAKLADRGIILEEKRDMQMSHSESDEPQGCLQLGMPL